MNIVATDAGMYAYTICFIKRGRQLLMLNRNFAPAKGLWNGVGGKLEHGETPLQGVLKEIYEETGIQLESAVYKGVVSWEIDSVESGGMYAFLAELPDTYEYATPRKMDEGILDWKDIEWILSEQNFGVGELIPRYLPRMLTDTACYEHKCKLENNKLAKYSAVAMREVQLGT